MFAVMDELEQKYPVLVERINGYPIREAARAAILAEIEAIYRQERSRLPPDDIGDDMIGNRWRGR